MSTVPPFRLRWNEGPTAQIEVFSPTHAGGVYQMKYTPAFRTAIRPPLQQSNLGPGEFPNIEADMDRLIEALDPHPSRRPAKGTAPSGTESEGLGQMVRLGDFLYTLTLPGYVRSDLDDEGLFIELGLDETLLGYPWELMHDGQEFLCLKHSMGRFVNASSAGPIPARTSSTQSDTRRLSVLLISVPTPVPRGNQTFEPLPSAEAETMAVTKALASLSAVDLHVLSGNKANFNSVWDTLRKGRFHIIHFCGHATFNPAEPRRSALVLQDKDMATGALVSVVSQSRPILCFVNACDSARSTAPVKERLNIYGLAQALLETGAYLLGSRWKVSDQAAATFAETFYGSLLAKNEPLGVAIRHARGACKAIAPDSLAWASYVLYGDPRVCFSLRRD